MQSNWPSLPNWVLSKVVESSSKVGQTWSGSSTVSAGSGAGAGSQHVHSSGSSGMITFGELSSAASSHFKFNPSAGKAVIGGGLAAVLQAAGGVLRFLGRGADKLGRKPRKRVHDNSRNHAISIKASPAVLKIQKSHMEEGAASPGAASLLLNKFTSLLLENLSKFKSQHSLPTVFAAMLPPLTAIDGPSNFLPFAAESELEAEKPCMIEPFEERIRPAAKRSKKHLEDGVIVEPRTGVRFPVQLEVPASNEEFSNQVLTGVGARAVTLIKVKSIMIYAFGLYVQPDQLRKKIGEKYVGVPPEELKHRADFYDDLLNQGVDMTMRLVVHYKGLKMGMVRNAFETSLASRLKKKGAENDRGLGEFCSLMSEDVIMSRGTTIDFRWQTNGGALQAEIGGRPLGTVVSPHLCRAFFDMYIGDPAVSEPAKLEIGESFARMLSSC